MARDYPKLGETHRWLQGVAASQSRDSPARAPEGTGARVGKPEL